MMLMIGGMKFETWTGFLERVERSHSRLHQKFKPWLAEEHPEVMKSLDEVIQAGKDIQEVKQNLAPDMQEMLVKENVTPQDLAEMYKKSVIKQME